MTAIDFGQQIENCAEIVEGTPRLNGLLHNADFIENLMKKLKNIWEDNVPPLGLVLTEISNLLRSNGQVKGIIKDECKALPNDPMYPVFWIYCSFVVYSEHIRISSSRGN